MHVCIFVHVGKWREAGREKEKEKSGRDGIRRHSLFSD